MRKYLEFLVAGVPGLILALLLNYALVSIVQMDKMLAYSIVLFVQVSTNFLFCYKYVFKEAKTVSLYKTYLYFMSGISLFRFVEWIFYSVLTTWTAIHFMIAQIGLALSFSFGKFFYSKVIFKVSKTTDHSVF